MKIDRKSSMLVIDFRVQNESFVSMPTIQVCVNVHSVVRVSRDIAPVEYCVYRSIHADCLYVRLQHKQKNK